LTPQSEHLFLCGETQNMLLKEEASKTVIQTSATLPRASVKTKRNTNPKRHPKQPKE
jgi:hypothetical protein